MKLIKPCYKYKNLYFEAIKDVNYHINFYRNNESFNKMVKRLNDRSKGINLSKNDTKSIFYWIIVDNILVGYIDMRLKENNLGHVGYMIFEKYRGNGYATKALSIAIKKYQKLNIKKIKVYCLKSNISSIKVIEKNHGILVEEIENFENNNSLLKYEIKSF